MSLGRHALLKTNNLQRIFSYFVYVISNEGLFLARTADFCLYLKQILIKFYTLYKLTLKNAYSIIIYLKRAKMLSSSEYLEPYFGGILL